MPRRYNCEYCQKSFQDTVQARKKHLNGLSHQRNRKAYYDSAMALTPPASHVLYSGLSGAEILQQWLAKHPEVTRKHKAYEDKATDDDKSASLIGRETSLHSVSSDRLADVPVELQPYRDVLPPSLLPPSMREPFSVPNSIGDWG